MSAQIQLSESQQKAVEAPWKGKVNLVLATAGSGKTLALTRRAVRIASELVQQGAFNSRLLCICFNKSAADEMAERLIELVQHQGLFDSIAVTRKAHLPKDMVTIEVRTFHALGYWILRTSSSEQRQCIGLRPGQIKLMAAKDIHLQIRAALLESREISPVMGNRQANGYSRACERPLNTYKRKLCDWECEEILAPGGGRPRPSHGIKPTQRTYECYQQRMNEQNCIDFEDMTCKAIKMATTHEHVRSKLRSRYAAVLVDEFQDLTPAEFLLCKVLVEKTKSLTFVGDDDQQIYSFRSSTTWFCHESLANWFSADLHTMQLPENRRCPGAVVKSANAVIRRNSRRAEKDIVSVHPDGSPVRIIACRSQDLEISFVIHRVKALLPLIKGTRDQILILFRTNALLQQFQKEFKAAGIATSRVLTDPGRADSIGPKTSASFALIALMSQATDRATFIWAAVTVSPTLERLAIEKVLGTEASTGKVECDQPNSRTDAGNGGENNQKDENHGRKPFPSPFLEQVVAWFEREKQGNMQFQEDSSFEGLYVLLERAEQLMMQLRTVTSAAELVKYAEEIVSSASGEFEAYPEIEASQQEFSQTSFDESKAGYELLNSAARKIDEDEEEDAVVTKSPMKTEAVVKEEDESEEEDFSSLFSQDKQSRSRKRRKVIGGTASTQTSISQQKARVGKKIRELCETLDSTLTKSDKKGGRKISRTERPPTVLSTIHKAKGVTFAYVFLCGTDTFNFPINARHDLMTSGSIDLQSLTSQEERRMFFVSMTRTQKEFVCTYSIQGDFGATSFAGSQSPFLAELKQEVGDDATCITEAFIETQEDVHKALGNFDSGSLNGIESS